MDEEQSTKLALSWANKEQHRTVNYSEMMKRVRAQILVTPYTYENPSAKKEWEKHLTFTLGEIIGTLKFEVNEGTDAHAQSHLQFLDASIERLSAAYILNEHPRLENIEEIKNAQREIDTAIQGMLNALSNRMQRQCDSRNSPATFDAIQLWFSHANIWETIDGKIHRYFPQHEEHDEQEPRTEQKNAHRLVLGMKEKFYCEKLLHFKADSADDAETLFSAPTAVDRKLFDSGTETQKLVSIVDIGTELQELSGKYTKSAKHPEGSYDIKTELRKVTDRLGKISTAVVAASDDRIYAAGYVEQELKSLRRHLLCICEDIEKAAKETNDNAEWMGKEAVSTDRTSLATLKEWIRKCPVSDIMQQYAVTHMKDNGLRYHTEERESGLGNYLFG